jgi:P27 family predicted phage terminase small subunit
MRTSGQQPVPTELLKIRGTYREDRHGTAPIALGDLTRPPPHFDGAMRASWRYALDHAPRGLLKLIDRGVLCVWVEAEARHFEATKELRRINRSSTLRYLIAAPGGGLVANPLVDVIDKAGKTMMRSAQELGFSPVARPRIRLDRDQAPSGTAANDPWATLRVMPGGLAN